MFIWNLNMAESWTQEKRVCQQGLDTRKTVAANACERITWSLADAKLTCDWA